MLTREEHGRQCETSPDLCANVSEYERPGYPGDPPACEDAAFRARQRDYARRPRPNGLLTIVMSMLENDPRATTAQILSGLAASEGAGVIDTVTDQIVEWHDSKHGARDTPVTALPSLIWRARKAVAAKDKS